MKRLMVVAGGKWQVPIVQKAKELGLYVLCSNLYPDSPAFEYADESEVANVLDIERNLQIAIKFKPDAIISDQSDIAVKTVAYLNEKLGLRGIGYTCAQLFTNKYLMREFCKKNNFPIPDYKLCTCIDDAKTFLASYHTIIIKPIDSQASRGVFKISSEAELDDKFDLSLQASNSSKCVLVEQYISGIEFTVDGIAQDGIHNSICISQKKHYEQYPNVASGLYFVNESREYDLNALKNQNNKLVEAMGLPFGLTHAEYILHKGRYYLVEVAARGGGTNISGKIVPVMSEIDTNKKLIQMALNQHIDVQQNNANKLQKRCCVLKFFDFPMGYAKKIHGIEYLNSNKNILEYNFNFNEGDYIAAPEDDSKRPGHYIAWAESEDELNILCEEIKEKVWVEYASSK